MADARDGGEPAAREEFNRFVKTAGPLLAKPYSTGTSADDRWYFEITGKSYPTTPEEWKPYMSQRNTSPQADGSVAPVIELKRRTDIEQAAALAEAHATFKRWLGDTYDLDAINATLAAAKVQDMDGDPLWLLNVSGSGNAKTETVQSLHTTPGVHVVSTVASEGALLSATAKKERAKDATGGLLRQVGESGVLVLKDVTSILSQSRDARGQILAAFREIYDGAWYRDVGTDGGKRLEWIGRLTIVGAVTTAWDQAHAVIAAMGDRFVLIRTDSSRNRLAVGRKAIANTGSEKQMRAELADAVRNVLAGAARTGIEPSDDEAEAILLAAELVTLSRTAVEYDYRGDVVDAHAPEAPTRFAKQLNQVLRGGVAIGMDRGAALRLAIRCARDSMPPMRLAIIDYLAVHPMSSTSEVCKGIDKPRTSVDRQLQALHMLGVLTRFEHVEEGNWREQRTSWRYRLVDDVAPEVLQLPPEVSPDLAVGA